MKTLPKLSEYVKLVNETGTKDKDLLNTDWYKEFEIALKKIVSYTNFLTQPLNLSHFVPAKFENGVWIVLSKPMHPICDNITEEGLHERYKSDCKEYQTALENVVFKGFYMNDKDKTGFGVLNDNLDFFWIRNNGTRTIEDLIPYNLEVTDTIIKKFGL